MKNASLRIRPDGTEIYVQSGWLRASQRQLDTAASTDLRPVQTHLEADAAPLVAGEVTPVRVELFPVAHPFRAGSRIRLTVDAPGNARGVWVFDTIADGERVTSEAEVGPALERAARVRGPWVLDVNIDPAEVPPSGRRNRSLMQQGHK